MLAYIAVRTYVLGNVEPLTEPFPPFHQASVIAYSIFTHFQILLLPQTAHLCYQVVTQEIANANTFIILASLAVLTWFLWSYRRTAPILFFGMAWFFVTILPVSALAGCQLSTIVSQRFLYLPSVGLAVVFGWGLAQLLCRSVAIRAIGVGVAAVILLALSVLSVQQSRLWTNEVLFWEQFVRDTPTIGDSYYHLGLAYHRAGHYKKALKAHQAAAELMPDRPEPDYGLGEAYKALGDYDRADRRNERPLR